VGATFRAAREWLGLSQQQVADLTAERGIRVSRSAVCDIERGCNMPGIESLVSLCEVLQLDPRGILESVLIGRDSAAELASCSASELRHRGLLLYVGGKYRAASRVYAVLGDQLARQTPSDPFEHLRLRARVECVRATSLRRCGQSYAAEAAARRALHLGLGFEGVQVEVLTLLASLHTDEALVPLAEAEIEQAVRIAEAAGSARLLRLVLSVQACLLFQSARMEDAIELFRRSTAYAIETGDAGSQSRSEGSIGICLAKLGHPSAARVRFRRALDLARRGHDGLCEANVQIAIGRMALLMEDLDEAEQRAAAALKVARGIENPLTTFSGMWLGHSVARRRKPHAPDRHRVSALRRLYASVANDKSAEAVREFRREVLGVQDA